MAQESVPFQILKDILQRIFQNVSISRQTKEITILSTKRLILVARMETKDKEKLSIISKDILQRSFQKLVL